MTDDESGPQAPTTPRRPPERLAREAAALRANLRRRKAQARARSATDDGDPDEAERAPPLPPSARPG